MSFDVSQCERQDLNLRGLPHWILNRLVVFAFGFLRQPLASNENTLVAPYLHEQRIMVSVVGLALWQTGKELFGSEGLSFLHVILKLL